jgi:hypothetical protein
MIYFLQTQIVEKEFYQKLDFYIFLLIGGFGLYFSILSWKQAKGARAAAIQAEQAAERAGKIVKMQDILLDIIEIVNLCQLVDINDDYKKANHQLTTIIGKISRVFGLIKEDSTLNQSQLNLISEIEKLIEEIQNGFKNFNPIYMDVTIQQKEIDNRIYYFLAPQLQILVQKLNQLSGSIHGKMIQNK